MSSPEDDKVRVAGVLGEPFTVAWPVRDRCRNVVRPSRFRLRRSRNPVKQCNDAGADDQGGAAERDPWGPSVRPKDTGSDPRSFLAGRCQRCRWQLSDDEFAVNFLECESQLLIMPSSNFVHLGCGIIRQLGWIDDAIELRKITLVVKRGYQDARKRNVLGEIYEFPCTIT